MSEYQGTSPIKPRQLHDLRLAPTATDPRPTFFWSAESPRDTFVTSTEFPKLLWHGVTNQEITVQDVREQEQKLTQGYQFAPVDATPADVVQDLSQAMADLTEEEQAYILETQKQARMAAIAERLADLSDADLDRLMAAKPRGRKKTA